MWRHHKGLNSRGRPKSDVSYEWPFGLSSQRCAMRSPAHQSGPHAHTHTHTSSHITLLSALHLFPSSLAVLLLLCVLAHSTLFPQVQKPFSSPFHLWLIEMTYVSVSQWWCHWLLWRDCPARALLCGSSSPAVACCLVCRHTQKKRGKKQQISRLGNKTIQL